MQATDRNAARANVRHSGQRRGFDKRLSVSSIPHTARRHKTPCRRTLPTLRVLDAMIAAQRPRRVQRPAAPDPVLTAQAEALEAYIYAHGVPTIRHTESGERRYYLWRALGGKDYHDLEQMGWRREDVLAAMRAVSYRGGWIEGRYPGVLVVAIVDPHREAADFDADEVGDVD